MYIKYEIKYLEAKFVINYLFLLYRLYFANILLSLWILDHTERYSQLMNLDIVVISSKQRKRARAKYHYKERVLSSRKKEKGDFYNWRHFTNA